MSTNNEKLLVCVSASPSSAGLIRAAGRLADGLHSKWFALYVETPGTSMMPEGAHERALENLRLAEQLGAETVTVNGRDVAAEIIGFAQQRGITRIMVGKPGQSLWSRLLPGSPVDRLVRTSGDIHIDVVAGAPEKEKTDVYVVRPQAFSISDYGTAILYLILATGLSFLMYPHFDLSNLIMVYLLAVLVTAIDCGRGPAILNSALSVLAFDFCFVPPRYSFTVDDAQYIVTFVVMFVIALAISQLTARMRKQTEIARLQEKQATALHGLSRLLAGARGTESILKVAIQYLSEIYDSQVIVLKPGGEAGLSIWAGDLTSVLYKDIVKEFGIARSALETGQTTGLGTSSEPATGVIYVPLRMAETSLGVLALRPSDPGRFQVAEQRYLLESLAKQLSLALEVEHLTEMGKAGSPSPVGA